MQPSPTEKNKTKETGGAQQASDEQPFLSRSQKGKNVAIATGGGGGGGNTRAT